MLALLAAAALAASDLAQPVPPDPATAEVEAETAPPPTVPPPVATPELWRGARVGMTPAQVKALFPFGRQPLPQISLHPPIPNAVSGGAAGWAVDEQVFGRPAVATYYFTGPQLLEVVVSVKELRLRHTRDNVDAARAIEAGMRGYYGRPRVCLDTSRRGLTRLDCRWLARGVQVGLSYADYGGLGPNLDVAVRALPPKTRESGIVFSRHSLQ